MSRRKIALGSLLVSLLVLLIAGAAVVVFRKPLLQAASDHYLEQMGTQVELTVAEVGFSETVLEDLRFHNTSLAKAEAREVRIGYTPMNLFAGILPELEVRGLELVQRLPELADNDSSSPSPSRPADSEEHQPNLIRNLQDLPNLLGDWELSNIQIQNGRYSLLTDESRSTVEFEGELQRLEPARHTLNLSMRPVENGSATISGNLSLSLSGLLPVSGEGRLKANIPALGMNGQLEFSGQEINRSPELNVNGNLLLRGGHWAAYFPEVPPQDETQETRFIFDGRFHLPDPNNIASTSFSPADLITQSQARGTLEFQVIDLALPQQPGKFTTRAKGRYTFEKGHLSFFPQDAAELEYTPSGTGSPKRSSAGSRTPASLLSENSILKLVQPDKAEPLLELRDVTSTPAIHLASELQLTGSHGAMLSANLNGHYVLDGQRFTAESKKFRIKGLPFYSMGTHEISGSFRLSGSATSYEGHSQIRFKSEGLDTAYVSFGRTEGHALFNLKGKGTESFDINLNETAQISVHSLSLPVGIGVPEAEFELEGSSFHYRNSEDEEPRLMLDGQFRTQPLDFRQFRYGGTPLTGRMEDLFLEFSASHILGNETAPTISASGELARLQLDDAGLSLEELSLKANYPQEGKDLPLLKIENGILQSTASPPLFAKLNLTGHLNQTDGKLRFILDGQNPDTGTRTSLEGTHNLEDGTGAATVSLPSHHFVSGGLQPRGLFPVLDVLENVEGAAAMDTNLGWNTNGLAGRGQLYLTDLDFTFQDITVDGLNSSFHLNRLMRLETDQAQHFSIESIELGGLEIGKVSGLLTLSEGAAVLPVLTLVSAQGNFADGRLRIEDGRFNLTNSQYNLLLKARNLSIEQLVSLLDIEGLQADGRLSGEIPVTVSGSTFEITEGHLQASRKGRIVFRSEKVRSALASGGEAVMLMMDALENFHYDELRIEVHKPKEGESRLNIKLRGKNPNVLDGHPFDLNINLSGNLEPILQAVAEGRQLSQNALDEMLELVR